MGRNLPQHSNNQHQNNGPLSLCTGLLIHCHHCCGPHKVLDYPTAPADVKSTFKLRFCVGRRALRGEEKNAMLMHFQTSSLKGKMEGDQVDDHNGEAGFDHGVTLNGMVKADFRPSGKRMGSGGFAKQVDDYVKGSTFL